ncbi:MAG: hypothetical protein AVDCRST_MAG33-2706 [uncultured Thermomicrobiales bacterium]|uniref:Uncharacterized protein n=1 Tax=uncultured Thermomicrobiales bacterium TaxID=1645740 RepID=A0A6J4V9P3_9BACT|nr:MAG: hypothetical protein AVDCRST_MAG33-2706 [uncultured Thermomicrobiales bacterium]
MGGVRSVVLRMRNGDGRPTMVMGSAVHAAAPRPRVTR